jgi:hypothetical protein
MMRTRYTDLGKSGGLYWQKFNNKNEGTGRNQGGNQGGQQGPTPWCVVVPLGSISYSFSSRDFSFLIKTTKVKAEKFNANLF